MTAPTALAVFPLIAAILFAIAALTLKRSSQLGVSVWQTAFVVNVVNALCYLLLAVLSGPTIAWELLWQPALIACCLFAGMATQFIALERGDVSVIVPILGTKVLLVAFLTPFLVGETVWSGLWVSAVLSVTGVAFLNWQGSNRVKPSLWAMLVAGCVSAPCFALFDILVQKWGPTWGASRLLPIIFSLTAGLSVLSSFVVPVKLGTIPKPAWKWLLSGALLIGLQSILFVGCVAVYGGATRANIFYSIRGLVSVLLVWTIGHWFSSVERSLGLSVLCSRLLGAAFLLTAIIIAIWG